MASVLVNAAAARTERCTVAVKKTSLEESLLGPPLLADGAPDGQGVLDE